MMRLKIIAFFLSFLMLTQMLPMSQIGQLINSNQLVEELPHNSDDSEGKIEVTLIQTTYPQTDNCYTSFNIESKEVAYLHSLDNIPSNHSLDVIDHPPNFSA